MTNEELGTRGNPIYVLDDDEIQCGDCWEEGHFTGELAGDPRLQAESGKSTTLCASCQYSNVQVPAVSTSAILTRGDRTQQ
jgi:hypothetical protein